MIVLKRAWRVVTPKFARDEKVVHSYHEDEPGAKKEAERLHKEAGIRDWYKVEPCFLLEMPQEKGPSFFFDLGAPVVIRRSPSPEEGVDPDAAPEVG